MKKEINKHIGAYGLIIRDGKIALIKKARGGYLGKLDLPGGGIEHTESPEEALVLEINEEAGLKVIDYELIDVVTNNIIWQMKEDTIEDLHHFGVLYKVNAEGILKEVPDGLDSNGCNWYEINKLNKEEVTPFVIYGLEQLGYKLK